MKVYVVYYICELDSETLYDILEVCYKLKDAQTVMNQDANEFERQIEEEGIKGYSNYKRYNEELSINIIGFEYTSEWYIEEKIVI